jgi:uncharacterized membrane protein
VTAPPRDTSPDVTAAASIGAELVAAERMIFFADAVVAIAITLLMMVITPFATRVLSGDGGFAVRFTFYALVQVTAAVCLLLMAREIARHDLLRAGTPKSVTTRGRLVTLTIIAMFLVSIPVSFFTQWAYACWIAIPLVIRAARWLIARRHSAALDGASG